MRVGELLVLVIFLVFSCNEGSKSNSTSRKPNNSFSMKNSRNDDNITLTEGDDSSNKRSSDDYTGWEVGGMIRLKTEDIFRIVPSGTNKKFNQAKLVFNDFVGYPDITHVIFRDASNNVVKYQEYNNELNDVNNFGSIRVVHPGTFFSFSFSKKVQISDLEIRLRGDNAKNNNISGFDLILTDSDDIEAPFKYQVQGYTNERIQAWNTIIGKFIITDKKCGEAESLYPNGRCSAIRYLCRDVIGLDPKNDSVCEIKLDNTVIRCEPKLTKKECENGHKELDYCDFLQKQLSFENQIITMHFNGSQVNSKICSSVDSEKLTSN